MDCGGYREKKLYHFKELEIKYLLQSNNIEFVHDKKSNVQNQIIDQIF